MSSRKRFLAASAGAIGVAILLFAAGVFRNHAFDYWYLIYNLVLAVIPLLLSLWIVYLLKKRSWKNWQVSLLTLIWLLFLPNSFYIVTDFIHLVDGPRVDIVQDAVMLMTFSVLGLVAGFASLEILHRRWSQAGEVRGMVVAMAILFLSSLAIYLGRELRWNSWDIILYPRELIHDAVLLWVDPRGFPGALWMIASFFGMLSTLYLMWWYGRKIKV